MPSKNPSPKIPNMCPLLASLPHDTGRRACRATFGPKYSGSADIAAKHFIKKTSHRRPCAAVGLLAVERGGQHRSISSRVGKSVQRVAVTDDLPVADVSRAHLVREGFDLLERCKRIISAGTDQHAGLHVAGDRRRPGCENTVKADDSFEI